MLATIAVPRDASAQQPPTITQQTATIKRTPLLQENCGKLAAETFRREPADENRVDYRAHYNIRRISIAGCALARDRGERTRTRESANEPCI
jgi:hypothetical protein